MMLLIHQSIEQPQESVERFKMPPLNSEQPKVSVITFAGT